MNVATSLVFNYAKVSDSVIFNECLQSEKTYVKKNFVNKCFKIKGKYYLLFFRAPTGPVYWLHLCEAYLEYLF